jgi:hypothetical protein
VRPDPGLAVDGDNVTPLMPIKSWAVYFNSMHWLGAVYTYRPWKIGYRSVHRKSHVHYAPNSLVYFLALFPVLTSAVGAFIIMWYAVPAGWSCRHIWVVGVTVVWLLSNTFTIWLHNDKIPAKEVYNNAVLDHNDNSNTNPIATRNPQPNPILDANNPDPSPNLEATRTTNTAGGAIYNQGNGVDASAVSNLDNSDEGDGRGI